MVSFPSWLFGNCSFQKAQQHKGEVSSSSGSGGLSSSESSLLLLLHPVRETIHSSLSQEKDKKSLLHDYLEHDETFDVNCPEGTEYIGNVITSSSSSNNNKNTDSTRSTTTAPKIPRQVFQTSKSKCVVSDVANAVRKWQFGNGWDYLVDDDQVQSMFRRYAADFPLLAELADKCLIHGTLKADVWRYLVLWEHGGVYADIDAVPTRHLTPEMILGQVGDNNAGVGGTNDGFFVVEQYHLLSQYFIAISPRHPLMWYALHTALANVLASPDIQKIDAAYVTGPHALHAGLQRFQLDVGKQVVSFQRGEKPVHAGVYEGTENRSITVIGIAENQNEFVNRDVLRNKKKWIYERMGMVHFSEQARQTQAGISCFKAISTTLPIAMSLESILGT